MEIPTNLNHKPVIVVKDYEQVDGTRALHTDVKALSLGVIHKSAHNKAEISGKVWHRTGEKWSQQSQELPITRILDLAILAAQGSVYFQDAYRYKKFYNPENSVVDIIGLQGNRMTVEIETQNPKIDEDVLLYYDTLQKEGELIGERFRILKRLLDDLGY
ncbi:DUF6530 family protein [Enterococcus ratti]|uniref:Uncharacterized protein n=1 Tax=Enterococcus ratti TaxID=150033 RepID=A0A1L8WSF1_9ENTE|nr:DUF6530 family protein [Enterococcus ratti]OJG83951.1 hypothetical protein RV14_GL000128 [Enterococcus ratti]